MNIAIPVDLRIDPEWLIPVEPAAAVLRDHALIVNQGRIVDLLPLAMAEQRYAAIEHQKLPGHALIPGLVNLHTHAAMTLLRGYADDRTLMDWLQNHIWPAEARWVSPEFVRDGSELACLEMLEGGITCFSDMYFFPGATLEAAKMAGQRVVGGLIVIDFASAWASDADAYLQRGLELRDTWLDSATTHFALAPHAPYSTSNRTLEKVALYANQLEIPVHIHLHETQEEIRTSLQDHGVRPLARLDSLGLVNDQLIAVHAVHLQDSEIHLLAQRGAHVAHCPASNLKLASGICPLASLAAAGVNIGIGTDGAASNNRLDMLSEMCLAALLGKVGAAADVQAIPAAQALEMATLGGARALGLDAQIGSLSPGKQADMVAIDLSQPTCQPCFDPVSTLVYAAGRESVRQVWVSGQQVVRDGMATRLNRADILRRTRNWASRIKH
jgi:5-methylthioadenosine/S-adenosylhomocysteine deaminase